MLLSTRNLKMSGISDSIEMDTSELKQNKASFSCVIPKGISAKKTVT